MIPFITKRFESMSKCVFLVLSFLVGGCVTEKIVSSHNSIDVTPGAQWRECAGSDIHVAEVVFPVTQSRDDVFIVKIGDIQLNTNFGTNLQTILWWRFSDVIGVPQVKMLSVAFSDSPKTTLPITIQDGTQSIKIPLSKYHYPQKRIEAISRINQKEIAVKVVTECAKPEKVFINGVESSFQIYSDVDEFLIIKSPLRKGDASPLFLDIQFSDGDRRFSYGHLPSTFQITLDGANEDVCEKLSIDSSSICKPLKSEDVCCIDGDSKKLGYAIPIILKELSQPNVHPNSLHFCSTATPFSFDAYSPLADFASSSDLSFLIKTNSEGKVLREQERLRKVINTMRPKPVYWFAPLFKQGEIHLSGDEANLLFLSSVALGVKGVRCHLWDFAGDVDNGGLSGIDELKESVTLWSKIRKRYDLGSLLPCGEFDYKNIHVWIAINPRKGLFVVWKKKDTVSDLKTDRIQISLPKYMTFSKVEDVISGKRILAKGEASKELLLSLPKDSSYGAMWIFCK